jgi:glycine cleavage system regulatory protein
MTTPLVFTFVGADQPGLVEKLSRTVAAYGGNWLESRMSALAGQFAGIVQVEIAKDQAPALRAALLALSAQQLSVLLADQATPAVGGPWRALRLSILGNDRPGIVREVASALAARSISVREMDTSVTSAPMSGEPLFEAVAQIEVPQALDLAELRAQLNRIADALTLDIALEESQHETP